MYQGYLKGCLKGIVSVISSDLPREDGNTRFTTVQVLCLIQKELYINIYNFEKKLLAHLY